MPRVRAIVLCARMYIPPAIDALTALGDRRTVITHPKEVI
jgi:hypothetical protein